MKGKNKKLLSEALKKWMKLPSIKNMLDDVYNKKKFSYVEYLKNMK